MCRTIARPSPSPAVPARARGVAAAEPVEDVGQDLGVDAWAVVLDPEPGPRASAESATRTQPPSGANLIAFDSGFHTTCTSRAESPTIGSRASQLGADDDVPRA